MNQIRVTRARVNWFFALSYILFLGLSCENEYALERPFVISSGAEMLFRNVPEIFQSVHQRLSTHAVFSSQIGQEVIVQQVNGFLTHQIRFQKLPRSLA